MSKRDEILQLIRGWSFRTGKTKYECEELTQTVSLKYLENPKPFESADNLKNYVGIVVWNTYINLDLYYTELNFDVKEDEREVLDIDKVKVMGEMMKQLSDIERMWITQYIECDMNYSEIQRRTKITRQCAKDRIQTILDKWKHLDIYLD